MAEKQNNTKTQNITPDNLINFGNPLSVPTINKPKSIVNEALNNTKELLFGDYSKYIISKSPVFSSTAVVQNNITGTTKNISGGEENKETETTKRIPIPADISSFLDTAEVITNRAVMKLGSAGYKISMDDRNKIYKRVLQKMAQNGMMPDKNEVNDISLLKLLLNKKIISIPSNIQTNDIGEIINSLSASDRQRFNNFKNYYTKQAQQLDKILFGSAQQPSSYINVIESPLLQNTDTGSVIDVGGQK